MRTENDFASVGERLVAALWSYQIGIKSVDYEIKANRKRGFKVPPIMDELGVELLFLIGDRRVDELMQVVARLKSARMSPPPERPDPPVQ